MTNTTKRVLSALILTPLAVALILSQNSFYVEIVLGFVSLGMAWEYQRIAFRGSVVGRFLFIASSVELYWVVLQKETFLLEAVSFFLFLSMTIHIFLGHLKEEMELGDVFYSCGSWVMGALYVSVFPACLVLIYDRPLGYQWVIFVFSCIWMTDTGAWFFGKRYGKTKLSHRMSPKKTWEGTLAGTVIGVVSGVLVWKEFSLEGNFVIVTAAALLVSVFGQVGDLFESLLKRTYGVKDSSQLIPGHGGLLDRMDSAIFAAPLLFILLRSGIL